jgi:phospholipid/cholesterol/gamma-HCH transport system substrate-binding protein
MENRSHALLAGIFVVLLVAAATLAAIWIGRKDVVYTPYEMVTRLPVGGLSIQSQVRYQGMAVGQVQGLSIDQDEPGVIRIRIGILPQAPITRSTWGEISTQGVTGISNIDLRDDGASTERVASSAADLYEIPVRPGFFQKLQKSGVGMLEDGERVLDELEVFLSPENAKAFGQIMQNTAELTAALKQTALALEPTLKELPALVLSLQGTLKKVDGLSDDFSSLAQSARQTVNFLNSPSGPLNQAAKSLAQIEQSAVQLQSSTLPEINRMIDDIAQASRSFTSTARTLQRAPQSVLFGAPPQRPGPGEPGFEGFTEGHAQ